jgi:competence protein ComEC
MKRRLFVSAIALMSAAGASAPMAAPRTDSGLQMISIDVEGSGGTLFITPEGKSLLIDTGNPPNPNMPAGHDTVDRLVGTMHSFGVNKIDYLIITHYHVDHVGGFPALIDKMPVGTIIDHGENRQPDPAPGSTPPAGMGGGRGGAGGGGGGAPGGGAGAGGPPRPRITTQGYYELYMKALGDHKHIIAKPGMSLNIGSMNVKFVMADGVAIDKPLPGAGQPNPACEGMPAMADNGGEENARSVSSLITYGKTRIAAFGDLTWDREKDLVCPNNKVGKVDVFLVSNHGLTQSNSPALLAALQPIVVIEGNSNRKGDDPVRVKTIMDSGRVQGMWRLHLNTAHPDLDGPQDMIANTNTDPAQDKDYNLRLRILKDGDVTVINERNGYNKTYKTGG